MFGDSPWEYMSEEEKVAHIKKRQAAQKLCAAQEKKYRLRQLARYRTVELEAELRRRDPERK